MLLSQQAQLVRLDPHRAVVQVAGNWMGMVQSRASLLEQAIKRSIGGNRQLVLENHGGAAPMASTPSAAPAPAPPSTPITKPTPSQQPPSQPKPAPAPPMTPAAAPSVVSTEVPVPGPGSESMGSAPLPAEMNPPSIMDEKVKRFADFFNGQVLDVELDND
jgi:DNA polymerase-3 subunit gamma/tau